MVGEKVNYPNNPVGFKGTGRGRIRTCVGISQRIYSPPLLAAQAHAREVELSNIHDDGRDDNIRGELVLDYVGIPEGKPEMCGWWMIASTTSG